MWANCLEGSHALDYTTNAHGGHYCLLLLHLPICLPHSARSQSHLSLLLHISAWPVSSFQSPACKGLQAAGMSLFVPWE